MPEPKLEDADAALKSAIKAAIDAGDLARAQKLMAILVESSARVPLRMVAGAGVRPTTSWLRQKEAARASWRGYAHLLEACTVAPMPLDPLSVTLSLASLGVSASVAWLSVLKPGSLKIVRPSLIAFLNAGGDGPKVWFRALLYSTSRRGTMIESMHVRVKRDELVQSFTFWVCGEHDKLAAGCGLYVGHDGKALDHHFVLPLDARSFEFHAGTYELEIFATVVNGRSPVLLARHSVSLTAEHGHALEQSKDAVYFDWRPDAARYVAHVRPSALSEPLASRCS